ncbi:MAG: hypothetical protein FD133_1255 [Erysipelotrichaceae bacterium]|nr:MAG: hypothetical protein FD179_591 [Erysipelotrichaceae bacterium]TXT17716.1 MAG: hypothetical protein FD133_1255 [Erysipelotrichaceae bacterium]
MKHKLIDIAKVIRSKNSGPYEITFDIILKDKETFNALVEHKCINAELIASLYKIKVEDVITIVEFVPANAIKATIIRPMCSGDIRETDVYGAQQHAPLLDLEFDY